MLIDEEKLFEALREWEKGGLKSETIPLSILRGIIPAFRVPMKSPEQIRRAIKHFDDRMEAWHKLRGIAGYHELKHSAGEIADLLRWVLDQPQKTFDEKIFGKEKKDGVQKNTTQDTV